MFCFKRWSREPRSRGPSLNQASATDDIIHQLVRHNAGSISLHGTNADAAELPEEAYMWCSTGNSSKETFGDDCKCLWGQAANGVCVDFNIHKTYPNLDWNAAVAKDLCELSSMVYYTNSQAELETLLRTKTWADPKGGPGTTFQLALDWHAGRFFKVTNGRVVDDEVITVNASVAGNNVGAVVFRGSQEIQDWMADAMIRKRPASTIVPVGEIHNGFAKNLEAAIDTGNLNAILNTRSAMDVVYCSGHSLGGSLALLCACYFANYNPAVKPKLRVVTFAAARVGDTAAAEWINRNIPNVFNFAMDGDPVPVQPALSMGYANTGHYLLHREQPTASGKVWTWYIDIAPDSLELSDPTALLNHKMGDWAPAGGCALGHYRCDVRGVPSALNQFTKIPGEDLYGVDDGCGWTGWCHHSSEECKVKEYGPWKEDDWMCYCKPGFYLQDEHCYKIPDGL